MDLFTTQSQDRHPVYPRTTQDNHFKAVCSLSSYILKMLQFAFILEIIFSVFQCQVKVWHLQKNRQIAIFGLWVSLFRWNREKGRWMHFQTLCHLCHRKLLVQWKKCRSEVMLLVIPWLRGKLFTTCVSWTPESCRVWLLWQMGVGWGGVGVTDDQMWRFGPSAFQRLSQSPAETRFVSFWQSF